MHALLLWGLLLCPGDNKLKARVFYDILQDSLQPMISANDKDFQGSFFKLIELATKLVYKWEPEVNQGVEKKSDEKITEDVMDEIKEEFLNDVFDNSSKLSRDEYMASIATKNHWIFNPTEIRKRVDAKTQ